MAEKEYIEREAAQKIICGWCGVCENPTLEDLEKCDDICPQFSRIPAADVRPVVRGKWKYNPGDNIPYCSECMMPQDSECNFCPNCGAMMEES